MAADRRADKLLQAQVRDGLEASARGPVQVRGFLAAGYAACRS